MKKITLLFLVFPIISFAQIKLMGKVLDASTRLPIPYVNLENFSSKTGSQTNQDGVFELNLIKGKQTDTIKISCVGYLEKFITNLQSSSEIVYELMPVIFQLNEVKIGKGKWVDKEIGIVKKKGRDITFFNQMIQRPGLQRAVFMKNVGNEIAYIKTLYFYLGNDMFDAPFRIRVYENEKGMPGKDIMSKGIEFAASKKNSWNAFDISSFNLIVPENGFWVAVEWIKNDKYAAQSITYDVKNADGTKTKGKSFTYYGPEIIQRFDTAYGLTYTKYLANKNWFKDFGGVGIRENKRQVNVDLLIKATIQVCQ
ncbi:carboxypeptidase-like regulatory domain-containing protein [Pedobacter polaris]|uniref:Carboxypeptidase-like regulatory domain-containing protein n=1 Tax=Pedobacter polaris TaxID=2571273 RepID=A0A4V5P066_9SPHI|nr:carboxypeptidase-like regulatory domain-containing protein [Pedobacter polaris]TKC12322.1 carboxypeptidase-like regulatory domain-containing protein [Pedobacter polaris]